MGKYEQCNEGILSCAYKHPTDFLKTHAVECVGVAAAFVALITYGMLGHGGAPAAPAHHFRGFNGGHHPGGDGHGGGGHGNGGHGAGRHTHHFSFGDHIPHHFKGVPVPHINDGLLAAGIRASELHQIHTDHGVACNIAKEDLAMRKRCEADAELAQKLDQKWNHPDTGSSSSSNSVPWSRHVPAPLSDDGAGHHVVESYAHPVVHPPLVSSTPSGTVVPSGVPTASDTLHPATAYYQTATVSGAVPKPTPFGGNGGTVYYA